MLSIKKIKINLSLTVLENKVSVQQLHISDKACMIRETDLISQLRGEMKKRTTSDARRVLLTNGPAEEAV
jgi:hypothetical protein